MNALIKPIVKLLSFPITLLTLGLSGFVINAALLLGVAYVAQNFAKLDLTIGGLPTTGLTADTIVGAVVASIVLVADLDGHRARRPRLTAVTAGADPTLPDEALRPRRAAVRHAAPRDVGRGASRRPPRAREAFPDPWLRAFSLKANDVPAVVAAPRRRGDLLAIGETGAYAASDLRVKWAGRPEACLRRTGLTLAPATRAHGPWPGLSARLASVMSLPRARFAARLADRPLLADGGMGTLLFSRGIPQRACLDELAATRPDLVGTIHREYLDAGADLIETLTFGANRVRLDGFGLAAEAGRLNRRAAQLAREARDVSGRDAWVGGSIGPLGPPTRELRHPDEATIRAAYREQIEGLLEGGADLLVIETFFDLATCCSPWTRPGAPPTCR